MPPVPADSADAPGPIERIAGFAASLRDHGLTIGIAEQLAMVRAAAAMPLDRAARLDAAWRAIACHDQRDWRRWPDLFARYWYPNRMRGSTRISGQTRASRSLRQVVEELHERLAAQAPGAGRERAMDTAQQPLAVDADDAGVPRANAGASLSDPLDDRSMSQWLPQDLAQMEALVERIARALRRRLTRRWRDVANGARLDIRRTLRASLRTGGVPVHPVWRTPRRVAPRLFVLVDVSRSMETHAQFFLRVARAFVTAMDARVFVFHTRLAEITPLLRSDSPSVQEKVNAVTAGFGGGTRIATSLADFRGVHARAQLTRPSQVWVLSDGFDADPPHRLAEELRAVRQRGARVAWFHPSPNPPASEAMGMAVAAGHVERFHRLDSLADLARLAEFVS
jgi:uncharacterized protein with von Willebrand factor type A (vWA) domain